MATVLLARHGETDWNRDYRFQGHADPPLNDRGRVQARALADELADVRIDADRIRDMARGMADRSFVFSFSDRWLDMELVSLNADLGEYFGTTEGLLVVRAPEQASLNLKAGDVILKVGGRTPTSQASAVRILRSYGDGESVEFEIMRQKRKMAVTGTMPERDREPEFDEGSEFRR